MHFYTFIYIYIMIRNIIFDLGGVILNIDYHLTIEAFKKLGIENFDKIYSQSVQNRLFDDFETGKISASRFRSELKKHIPVKVTNTAIDKAWNALLLNLPIERLQLLKRLHANYCLFLLSNTNEINMIEFSKLLERNYRITDLSPYFNRIYFSYKIGMRKPEKSIFLFVLNENGLTANETLFIDDSPQHIEGARVAGLHARLLRKDETIEDIFKDGLPELK